jgi:TolB-like protein/DNA-binding winged helix-turn-helix (wHTH) protein/Tfp pilus assembly protein PilF
MSREGRHLYEFGPFRVDPDQRLLLRDNQPVPLQPKAFDTLLVLVENSQKVVLKEDLMKTVWPDTFVEESNLTQNIFVLRKILGETPKEPRFIVTLPGRGYRFAGEVRIIPIPAATAAKTPSKRAPRWMSVLAGLMVLLPLSYLAWRQIRPNKSPVPGRIMLAVLPFRNLTGDPEQDYFADGLTEELITQLSRLDPPQLGVIASTSVMPYKRGDKGLDRIGRELSVEYVLEGSFRRAGGRLRITTQLSRLQDQSHVWAEEYDRSIQDILTVQDEVGVAVAREIQLRLTPQQRAGRARPIDPETHEAYLKGRFFFNNRNAEGLKKAVEYFQLAIAKDTNYAAAYAGLADAYLGVGYYGLERQNDILPLAKAAALRAIALDPNLGEAWSSLGGVSQQYEWNWAEAERDYKRAIELNPNDSVAHHLYGSVYLAAAGDYSKAVVELSKAHQLDPLSPITSTALATALCFAGRTQEGMEQFRKTFEIAPDFVQAHYYLSEVYLLKRSYPEALAEIGKITSADPIRSAGQRGTIYALQGNRQEAMRMVDELQGTSEHAYVDPVLIGDIYAGLGDKDLALVWLEKGYQQHSPGMVTLRWSPVYDRIRTEPGFVDLQRRVGIP